MKKKIFAYILLMMPALLMTSCLKDQEDKFSDSATERASKYLANVREVLTSAENGWVLNYYPDREQKYGGFAFTLKFDEQNVTVGTEIAEADETITSTYSLDNEDGPVLAFDTYNSFMHFFATPHPSSGAGGYQAYDGDFIFIVMNVSEDKNTITLKGNRTGNIMYMHRLTESSGEEYLNDCISINDNIRYEVFKHDNMLMNIDTQSRQVKFSGSDGTKESAFVFTDKGIVLYTPITVNGKELYSFTYDKEAETFTSDEDENIVLRGSLPDGWKSYEELLGTYDIDGTTVEVVANADGTSYTINDFSYAGLSIQAYYKFTTGSLVIPVQPIGELWGMYYTWLLAFDGKTISWDTSIEFKGANSTTEPLVITFSNSSFKTLWESAFETEEPSLDSYAGYLTQYSTPFTMTKIENN